MEDPVDGTAPLPLSREDCCFNVRQIRNIGGDICDTAAELPQPFEATFHISAAGAPDDEQLSLKLREQIAADLQSDTSRPPTHDVPSPFHEAQFARRVPTLHFFQTALEPCSAAIGDFRI